MGKSWRENPGEYDHCAQGRVKTPKRLGHLHPDLIGPCACGGFVKGPRKKDRTWSRMSRAKHKQDLQRELRHNYEE